MCLVELKDLLTLEFSPHDAEEAGKLLQPPAAGSHFPIAAPDQGLSSREIA